MNWLPSALLALALMTLPATASSQAAPPVSMLPASPITPAPTSPAPKWSGYVQARETWQDQVGLTGTLNRVRVSADGTVGGGFTYRAQVEYEAAVGPRTAAGVSLRDAYIRWATGPFGVQAGQYKTPFTREYITSITAIETADRALVVDTLATKRDIGVMGTCDLSTWATTSLGVFNGEGQNASANRDSAVLIVGRLAVRPIAEVTLGGDVAAFESDSTRYSGDVGLEWRGLLARGEIVGQHAKVRDRDDLGWYALGGARVLPWLQLIGKLEDFQRPSIGVARRMSAITGGANLDLPGGKTRLIVDFVSRKTGFPRVQRNALVTQLQVRF